ncbi:MOSC domain-containing protein [Rhizobium sp. CG5]|uniref:MOSC domain-containing protein n=1 Tax=Rhizobium sp. CG5 TaxID=2726076 RepID=UPI002033828A|nr:MOSC domain-containing protein [Rhizobium sp. CG5]MCM2474025.1 MOSC domain-containing protein [Rhizobium sp. CG5]
MQVSELHVYPLKSARGIALTSSMVDAEGLVGDRRMMVVDASGHFVTQRELPALAILTVVPGAGKVQLLLDDGRSVTTPLPDPDRRMDVAVWGAIVSAAVCDEATNATLSGWLGRDLKLVHFDARARRTASADWAGPGTPVTFADGYQVLITTTGSLAGLNADMQAHGEAAVGMDRFRPNIVVDCDEPWADDRWQAISINGIRFDFVKPCARCIMTTQDQRTGSRDMASPMPAMGRLRMSADRRVPGPLFGWNATPRDRGQIAVGDVVTVISERPEGWAIKRR